MKQVMLAQQSWTKFAESEKITIKLGLCANDCANSRAGVSGNYECCVRTACYPTRPR